MQQSGYDEQVVPAVLDLVDLTAPDREFVVAGIQSAKALRNASATSRLIRELDVSAPENSVWYEDLVELSFGPLGDPHAGAEVCRQLMQVNSANSLAQQRLLFYYAMTLNHPRLLELVQNSADAGSAQPEALVYYFLSDSLRLTNAAPTCQTWLGSQPDDEHLRVALAIHMARNLDGSVPSVSEEEAALRRRYQQESRDLIASLLKRHPQNQALLAYGLDSAIERSNAGTVVELLQRAPDSCDADNRFWRSRGWLAARNSDWEDALSAYDRALDLYPVDWRTRYYRAETLRQLERLDEAEAEYELSREGRALQRELIQQPTVRDIDHTLMTRLLDHMTRCGLEQLAAGLSKSPI